MLDVRRLRVLLAVREHGGVAAAARALAFTPPAVSQQIAALERQVGRPLLDRDGRSARLTPAGELLATHGAAVLARLEHAESELAAFGDGGPSGGLRVGTIETLGRFLLPGALATLGRVAPRVSVHVLQVEPEQSLPALARGELDVVLASQYALAPARSDPRLHREDLGVEPMYVALPAGVATGGSNSPGGDGVGIGELDLAALRDHPWVTPANPSSCLTMLERACACVGFEPVVAGRCAGFELALALCAAGLGAALVPGTVVTDPRAVPAGVRLVRSRPEVARTLYVATRQGAGGHPAVAALLDALRPGVAALDLDWPAPARSGRVDA